MREKTYWLKSVGSAEWPMAADWMVSAPKELREVAFANIGKPSVRVGDYLVYYAAGYQKIFGIVEVFLRPTKDNDEPQWPWRCEVRPQLVISDFDRAPSLDILGVENGRNFRKSVQQSCHLTLTEEEYARAVEGLTEAYDPSKGDIRERWFIDAWTSATETAVP